MTIGPLPGFVAGVAGTPSAQTQGAEADRAAQEAGNQERQARNELRAASAAGIGQTDGENHETAERDADGRLPWELPKRNPADEPDETHGPPPPPQSKDPTGRCGTLIDLSG